MGCSRFHGNAPPPSPFTPHPSSHLCRDNQPVPREPTHPPANHPPSFKSSPSLFPPPLSALPFQAALEAALSQGQAPSRQPLEVGALRAHLPHIHGPPLTARRRPSSGQGPRFLSRPHHTRPALGTLCPAQRPGKTCQRPSTHRDPWPGLSEGPGPSLFVGDWEEGVEAR